MTDHPAPRVVFDCNVYFQALISPEGPSAKCIIAAARGQVSLFCSERTLAEFLDVAGRPALTTKFRITDDRVARLIESVREAAIWMDEIPESYRHPIDPDDSHYVNLAAASHAAIVVSRDAHLLRLMDKTQPAAQHFQELFPEIRIISPDALLQELAALGEAQKMQEPPD